MHFIAFLLCVSCVCAKLPHYIKPCARSDPKFNECAIKHANEDLKEIVKGDSENNIPPLDPLFFKYVKVDVNGFHITNKNMYVRGFRNAVVNKLNYDFKKKKYHCRFTTPRLELQGDYEVNGRILILPITGKGRVNCTMIDAVTDVKGEITYETKNGTKYLVSVKPEANMEVKRMYLRFSNLFNGNKLLEDEMNMFLDENWKEVYEEISKPGVDATVSNLVDIINKIHRIAPFEVMFPETLP